MGRRMGGAVLQHGNCLFNNWRFHRFDFRSGYRFLVASTRIEENEMGSMFDLLGFVAIALAIIFIFAWAFGQSQLIALTLLGVVVILILIADLFIRRKNNSSY